MDKQHKRLADYYDKCVDYYESHPQIFAPIIILMIAAGIWAAW